jgi:hypothetical protein
MREHGKDAPADGVTKNVVQQRLDKLLDPPGADDPPIDSAFAEHFNHVIAEIRATASEIAAVAAQLPTLELIQTHLDTMNPTTRAEREHDLLYLLVGAQVTLEQSRNWLQRVLRAGT